MTLILAEGEQNLADLIDDSDDDEFESADDLESEVYNRLLRSPSRTFSVGRRGLSRSGLPRVERYSRMGPQTAACRSRSVRPRSRSVSVSVSGS
ncbi:DUF5789 family protein [Natronolimnohabitans innermongolicus]